MYKSINTVSAFRDEFAYCGRKEQFSYDALGLLFDYLEEAEYQEIDVVALCCSYSEDTPESIAENYDIDLNSDGMCSASAYGLERIKDANLEQILQYLNDNTSVVGVTDGGGIVYCSEF